MKFCRSLQILALLFLVLTGTTTITPAGAEDLETLIKQLKSDRAFEREQAAEALGYLGNPQAIDPLIEALKDEDKSVSDAAAQALENFGDDPKAEEALSNR